METVAYYKQFLVADLGTSPTGAANSQSSTYPKPGYQNAPHFCQNTDKSLGTYSFNVPVDLAPGATLNEWLNVLFNVLVYYKVIPLQEL